MLGAGSQDDFRKATEDLHAALDNIKTDKADKGCVGATHPPTHHSLAPMVMVMRPAHADPGLSPALPACLCPWLWVYLIGSWSS